MSTQQDIYATGSENRPPMLNKENYVPWSSRLLCCAKSRPNGKLIYNSIMNGPKMKLMDELGIYLVQFGRVGHGESDLNPKWSLNTEAYDFSNTSQPRESIKNILSIQVLLGGPIKTILALEFMSFSSCPKDWLGFSRLSILLVSGVKWKMTVLLWWNSKRGDVRDGEQYLGFLGGKGFLVVKEFSGPSKDGPSGFIQFIAINSPLCVNRLYRLGSSLNGGKGIGGFPFGRLGPFVF
ncbi:hypothetical protein Tco_1318097 [Tanacetum coccineum]